VKEKDETPDPENAGGITGVLFDMERGIERSPSPFQVVLRDLLDRIIEKRLEYYWPPPESEE
jgi:hypothetical protein